MNANWEKGMHIRYLNRRYKVEYKVVDWTEHQYEITLIDEEGNEYGLDVLPDRIQFEVIADIDEEVMGRKIDSIYDRESEG